MRDDQNERDQRETEQERRDDPAHEKLGDRHRSAGGQRIDDHVVRGRQQQRLQRAGNGDIDGEQARIAVADHLRNHHRAHRSGIGHGRAGDAAEQGGGDDVHQRHPAANETHEHLGEIDQALGHASHRHDGAGENEEGDREQREAAHAARHFEHDRFQRNAGPQRCEDGGEPERVRDGHAGEARHGEAADENENVHHAGPPVYSVEIWLTASGSGSRKKSCVRRRSITNRTVSPPPMGIGR